jgi:hypothetical protein
MKKKISVKQTALCGVLLAVSIIILYFASFVPSVENVAMAVAGALVYIVAVRLSAGVGAIFYVASVLFALLLVPVKFAVLPYIFAFGPYGILKPLIEKWMGGRDRRRKQGERKYDSKREGNDGKSFSFIQDITSPCRSGGYVGFDSRANPYYSEGNGRDGADGAPADMGGFDGNDAAPDEAGFGADDATSDKAGFNGRGGRRASGKMIVRTVATLLVKATVFTATTGAGLLIFKEAFLSSIHFPDRWIPVFIAAAYVMFLLYDRILELVDAVVGSRIG